MIYSKRSGEVLIRVILRYGIDPKNMDAVCISENVALGVKGVGFRNIIIASEATEDKIIEQLQKNYKGSPK